MPRSSIFRSLFSLSLPIIGLNVLNVLAIAVDTAMCGALPEADSALKGLGFAGQLVFLLMVAMIGLTVGTVALVSRAHGAHDHDRVEHVMAQAAQFTLVTAVVVAVVGNLVAGPVMSALGASGDAYVEALRYLRPMLAFTVFGYLNILFAAVLRGVGISLLPFLIALGSNALNFVLNYGLILGHWGLPALGVQGAAIGTVISQAVAVVAMVVLIRRGVIHGLRLGLRPRRVDVDLARQFFSIGLPAAFDMVVLNAGFLTIVGLLGRIDDVAVAAHGIGLRVQALAFVPGMSVSQATGALVGQALGASDVARARRVFGASIVLCVGIMSALAALFWLGADPIVDVFGERAGPDLHGYAVQWMRILGAGMPIVGVWVAISGLLQGAGATRTSLAINALATLAIQIPLSALLGFGLGWGTFGVWVAFPLSFVVKVALGVVAYRRGGWAVTGKVVRA